MQVNEGLRDHSNTPNNLKDVERLLLQIEKNLDQNEIGSQILSIFSIIIIDYLLVWCVNFSEQRTKIKVSIRSFLFPL